MKMFKVVFGLMLVVGAVALAGCGGSEAERLVDEQIAEMEKMIEGMESGKSKAEMEAIGERGAALAKELEALELTEEEKKAIAIKLDAAKEKFKGRMEKIMKEKMDEMMSKGMDKLNQAIPADLGK